MPKETKMRVPFNRPHIIGPELEYIGRAVNDLNHISGNGEYTRLCQQWLERTTGSPKALLTHSCTAALEMSALLCGVGPGDEVIMPSYTFVSTANAIALRGGIPVFVDIRADTLNMDENLIEAAVTDKTKAVVPVHYAGVSCEMDPILRIAREQGLMVIEDAAQGLMANYHGRALGGIGDLGCLSFHETKNLICGEGGALLVNDESLMERAEWIWEKGTNRQAFAEGRVDKYTWVDLGSSYLPSDMIAAFLYAQFELAVTISRRRCELFRLYNERLARLEDDGLLRRPRVAEHCECNGHIFYILTRSRAERSALLAHLEGRGVQGLFHYVPLHSSPAGLRFGRVSGSLAVTDEISERVVRLPLYYTMRDSDVDYVADCIEAFYSSER